MKYLHVGKKDQCDLNAVRTDSSLSRYRRSRYKIYDESKTFKNGNLFVCLMHVSVESDTGVSSIGMNELFIITELCDLCKCVHQ